MNHCQNLYLLSTVACQLSECLDKDELSILAADLVVLSDMLANIIARQSACQEERLESESASTVQEETAPEPEQSPCQP